MRRANGTATFGKKTMGSGLKMEQCSVALLSLGKPRAADSMLSLC